MKTVERLKTAFRRLPGVGPRQAERFAMHFLRASPSQAEELACALRDVKNSVKLCRGCFSYCEGDTCAICADPSRDGRVICVVEEPQDIEAFERAGGFNGRYHVLHGAISPADGKGPSALRIAELLERVKTSGADEIIIATDPDAEGEASALYISRELRGLARVTRIGYGVPLGADLDYTDEATLGCAMKGRTPMG
ncbi:MAG: recombination mediator RecR [Elusimicrobiales bacterium]